MNFRGVSLDQDARFTNKDTKLRNSIAWPPIFSQRVQLRHVNMSAMRPWIQRRLSELAGYEDEILINYAIEMLENAIQNCETGVVPSTSSSSSSSSTVSSSDVVMDPREMQVNLTAFTDQEKAYRFMEELWTLLVSASQTPSGIPETFLEEERQRVLEMRKQQEQIRSQIEMRKSRSSGSSSGSNRRQMFGGRINDGGDDKRQTSHHSAEQHVQSLDHHRHHHTHHTQSRRRDNTQLEGHRFVNRRNVTGHENREYRRDGEDYGHGRKNGEKRPREESYDRSKRTDIREDDEQQQSDHVHRVKRARVDSDASTHDESHRSSKRPKIETTESVSGSGSSDRNVPMKPAIEKHGDQSKQSRSGSRSSSSDGSSDGDDGSSESSNDEYIRRRRSLRDGEGNQRSRPASPSKRRSSSSSLRREYGDDRRMEHDDRRTRTRNERDYDRSYDDRYRHSSRDQRSGRRRDGEDEDRDRDRDYHYGSRYARSRGSSGKSYHRDRSRDEYSRSRRQLSSSPPRTSPDRYGDSHQRKFDRDRESGSLRYMDRPAKSELKPRKSPLDATNSPPPASPPPPPPSLPQPASKSITDLAGKLRESMVKKEQPEQEPSN